MFLDSIDRVMMSSLFHSAPKILQMCYDYDYDMSEIFSEESFYIPKSFVILPINDNINKHIITYVDNKYKYFLINRLNYSIYCIDNSLKKYIECFIKPKTKAEISNLNCNKINSDYFDNLIKYNIIATKTLIFPKSKEISKNKLCSRFKIVKNIANNFSSSTFIVKDSYDKKYVLKAYHDNVLDNIQGMQNEIIARQRFKDYNFLPNILDFDYEEKYILMEYINGMTIKSYLKEHPTMKDRIRMAIEMAKILSILHSNDFLHGDLHLGQFLIDYNGQIKLLDWELCIDLSSDKDVINTTTLGGVFEYLAPETIQENPFCPIINCHQTKQSEVYRLGVAIYYIIYDEYPYIGFTWRQLYDAIKNESLICPIYNMHNQYVPQKIINLINGCLQKNPITRVSSANDIKI